MTDEKYMTESELLELLKTVAQELEIILKAREWKGEVGEITVAELLERYKGLIENISKRLKEGEQK